MSSPSPLPQPPSLPPPSSSSSSYSSSLLIIATLLAFAFVFTAAIHLTIRVLSRSLNSSTSPSPSLIHLNSTNSSTSISSISQTDPHRKSLIDSLPLFTLSSLPRCPSANCSICLSKFEVQDKLRMLPACQHAFHSPCIDKWIRSTASCPLCRSSIQAQCAEPPAEPPHYHHQQQQEQAQPPVVEETMRVSSWLKEYVDRLALSASSSFNSMRFSSWGSRRFDGGGSGEASGTTLELGESFRSDSGYFASSYKWMMAGEIVQCNGHAMSS